MDKKIFHQHSLQIILQTCWSTSIISDARNDQKFHTQVLFHLSVLIYKSSLPPPVGHAPSGWLPL